ncbi:MAG: ribose-phosphate diphosphokinase [Chloroflexota bacterium]|nr:ribose-phosphate diphosphokinase [Chloroflexota bacterium]
MTSSERSLARLAIVAGRSHPNFVARLCEQLQHPQSPARLRTFSDGAIEVKIEANVRGCDVFVVQSGHERPNDHVMELLFLIDAARRASARSVTAVLPYFPYGKGDKKDEPRVSIRGRVVADALKAAGAARVLTMDLHAAQLQGFFRVPVDNLYALPTLAAEIERRVGSGAISAPVFVSPDAGRATLAREYQRRLGHLDAGAAVGDKVRPRHDEQSAVVALMGDVRDRDAVLVDDIIFTGGTLCNMAEALLDAGARSVRALATHPLLTEDAPSRIARSPIAEQFVTDSVPIAPEKRAQLGDRLRVASVCQLFAQAIGSVYEETSISRLFD